jgi:hypothetical protein
MVKKVVVELYNDSTGASTKIRLQDLPKDAKSCIGNNSILIRKFQDEKNDVVPFYLEKSADDDLWGPMPNLNESDW